ncbi:CLUMA_CG004360, isoform A [Clunio marinus]|uniref:CLUMA_CG004360, isoform A n=1 Tax=Clunio marinus TaxID=568069 RepID=A0A1J1HRQ2_9DIPT|nr:CLUMA_CG004360, isoform A [Clunio marinus]
MRFSVIIAFIFLIFLMVDARPNQNSLISAISSHHRETRAAKIKRRKLHSHHNPGNSDLYRNLQLRSLGF